MGDSYGTSVCQSGPRGNQTACICILKSGLCNPNFKTPQTGSWMCVCNRLPSSVNFRKTTHNLPARNSRDTCARHTDAASCCHPSLPPRIQIREFTTVLVAGHQCQVRAVDAILLDAVLLLKVPRQRKPRRSFVRALGAERLRMLVVRALPIVPASESHRCSEYEG